MTEMEILLNLLENEYISKIYGFCCLKTNLREDAEDLAQDISYQVIEAIYSGKKIENFNAFVWSVSNHTFFNWLRRKKYGSTMYMTELIASDENIEKEYEAKEQKNLLHRELALLSEKYRKAIILHYFEGKSCEKIGEILGRSSGTIKWWLYDARKCILEGMTIMREYGEKSYKPGNLSLSCQGSPGANYEPMSCMKRKSAQNILLAAYKTSITIENLCTELGISAPYIEDEVQYLTENQLMRENSAGNYQTDFVILPGYNTKIVSKIYTDCFPEFYEKLIAFINNSKELLSSCKFNTSGFSWERLLWVYIHMITDINLCKFKRDECQIALYDDIPNRPNGGKWIALGFDNGFSNEFIRTDTSEFSKCFQYDGPINKGNDDSVQSFFHYWSGFDSSLFFSIPDGVFALCRDIIKGNVNIDNLSDGQKYLFSIAVEKKLFVKTISGFKQNYYYIDKPEFNAIEKLSYDFYDTAKKYYSRAYNIVLNEYLPEIPKHLQWQMGNFLSNHLNVFVTCSLNEAVNAKILSEPDELNKEWLSLFAI